MANWKHYSFSVLLLLNVLDTKIIFSFVFMEVRCMHVPLSWGPNVMLYMCFTRGKPLSIERPHH